MDSSGCWSLISHTDHLDTPRAITNQAAQVVWRWDHAEPFGSYPANENPSGLGAFAFNLRLPGQYFDKETNLHYNYFRDYDPSIGRYVQSDPIGHRGGINTYLYVRGNPLSLTDLLGLDPGDLFKTPDDAAIDARNYARRQPLRWEVEFAGWIYPVGQCWTYNWMPGPYSKDRVDVSRLRKEKPANPDAWWHTHTDNTPFSGDPAIPGSGDRNFSASEGVAGYVFNPSGTISRFDPRAAPGDPSREYSLPTPREMSPPERCCK